MPISINVDGDVLNDIYTFRIEGQVYFLHCYFNKRGSAWQAVLYDKNNNPYNSEAEPLLDLGKMMPNSALTWRYNIFKGELVCVDTEGFGKDSVAQGNFGDGKQYQIIYFSEEEIETFKIEEWTTYKRV